MCVANFYCAEFKIEDSGKLTKLFELVTEDTECKGIKCMDLVYIIALQLLLRTTSEV